MKLPVPPPDPHALLKQLVAGDKQRLAALLDHNVGPAPGGKYRHWETFRQVSPSPGFSIEEEWFAVKSARRALYKALQLRDKQGNPFQYALPSVALELLHKVDRSAGGVLQVSDQVTSSTTRDRYLFKSIVEEAITSSQLEGASTTRRVAKAMIREGRQPKTRSEQMILNNYQGLLFVRSFVGKPLTPELVFELQRVLTVDTLDDPTATGRFRTDDEDIVVEDETGRRLHTPPRAAELPRRLQLMCDFANGNNGHEDFMPPALRAVLLHFWLAYDHPFVDGNGRTARALFYWSMATSNYWLCEYVSISRILKKARASYARSFLYTESDENDLTYFVLYQLKVLLTAIDELHGYLARKAQEIREAEESIRAALANNNSQAALNHRQVALIDHALKNPLTRYTVESHQVSHGISYETARSDLTKLAHESLLVQSKAGRAFVFTPATNLREMLQNRIKPATRETIPLPLGPRQ